MNPLDFWLSVLTVLAIAAVAPAWLYFSGAFISGLPIQIRWLTSLLLPVVLLLTIASWTGPGGASS